MSTQTLVTKLDHTIFYYSYLTTCLAQSRTLNPWRSEITFYFQQNAWQMVDAK